MNPEQILKNRNIIYEKFRDIGSRCIRKNEKLIKIKEIENRKAYNNFYCVIIGHSFIRYFVIVDSTSFFAIVHSFIG